MHLSIRDRILLEPVTGSRLISSRLAEPEQTIVDLGAGLCDLRRGLPLHETSEFVALDKSLNMLRNGVRVLGDLCTSLSLVVSDAICCALSSNCSDVSFVIGVTPYVESVNHLASELARIGKPGGLVVLIHPEKGMFWEDEFEGVRTYFHDAREIVKQFDSVALRLLELQPICIYPIPDVRSIKLIIANLMIFENGISRREASRLEGFS